MAVAESLAMVRMALTGNEAAATAMRQIEPDVCAAYPITPSTQVMETFATFVADGRVDTELVLAESEHSAMSACVGAASAGARVMTATSSQGLALMHEVLYIASGLRLPIVMAVANRTLSAPLNIHCDHSDTMGSRDAGWLQFYVENAQELYDTLIEAVRVCEHPDVLLPGMVCFDGFTLSHGMEAIETIEDGAVKGFIGEYRLNPLLDPKSPRTVGPLVLPDFYMEIRQQQSEAFRRVMGVVNEVDADFASRFGRSYGLFEAYRLDGAEVVGVVIGSSAGTVKAAVDALRADGVAAGLLRLRVFRPFPAQELARALGGARSVVVLDRADSMGTQGGPLLADLRSALYGMSSPPRIEGFVYGLGGRDLVPDEARRAFELARQEQVRAPAVGARYLSD
jgi:pyruvate ferredoxin oxidoreductase alpha subunit